jgi:hypothetical protein
MGPEQSSTFSILWHGGLSLVAKGRSETGMAQVSDPGRTTQGGLKGGCEAGEDGGGILHGGLVWSRVIRTRKTLK